ncbi:MAG TPA: hypothetical protein VIH28_07050 [Ignavibacteriaceae bacterium]
METNYVNVENLDLKNLTSKELFLYTLNKIGRPSLARDMAEYLERNKLISMKKEEILIRLYTGATQLNKSKVVSRMPYDGRMYMYAIIKQQQFVNLTAQNKFKMVA